MGARLRRSGRAGLTVLIVTISLVGSAWLAFASTAPRDHGSTGSSGGVTTTIVKVTTTTTVPKCKPDHGHNGNHGKGGHGPGNYGDLLSKIKGDHQNNSDDMCCKPGWGFGDKNHCHTGPPGHNK